MLKFGLVLQTRSHEASYALATTISTEAPFCCRRHLAAPNKRYTPPTCAHIVVPNNHYPWLPKDTIWAQVG